MSRDFIRDLFFPPKDPTWIRKLRFKHGSLPVSVIRQSWLNVYRECHRKGLLYGTSKGEDKGSYFMFGGSVFHTAIEVAIKSPGYFEKNYNSPEFWIEMSEMVWSISGKSSYRDDIDYGLFIRRCTDKSILYGKTLGDLIRVALEIFKASGFEVRDCEKHMIINIPGGVPFSGTIDLVLWHPSAGIMIGDTKTGGLWKRYFEEDSIKTQSYKEEQVSHHTQLTHYAWMGWRLGLWEADEIKRFFIFTPANLTPLIRGPKKGKMRGPPFHFGSPHPRQVIRYEEDLISWLRMAHAGIFPRMYPSVFGKIECVRCPFRAHCLEDISSEYVPDYLRS